MRFRKFFILGIVAWLLIGSATAFAEIYAQKHGLFWIDVPKGWQCSENDESVILMSPSGFQMIQIDFAVMEDIKSDADAQQLVRQTMASKIRQMASKNGKAVMRVERKVDGTFALQDGFLISTSQGIRQATAIAFFRSRNLFNIYFEASYEFQRLEMEKIVDTIKFEAPQPIEEETIVSPESGLVANQTIENTEEVQ